ncbi:MAG: DUF697 domain-containing protein [Bacteroidota bacterium]
MTGKKVGEYALKKLKKSVMNPFNTPDNNNHADTVIRNHVIWSMGASYVIPLPVADVFAVSALQLDMIRSLCKVYGLDFAESQGKAIVSSLTTSTMARAGARSLIKLVPGVGTVIGGITVAVVNGASTYALGQVFKKHFSTGGTILDFDTDRLRKVYHEQFEKGKSIAKQWKTEEEAAEQKTDADPDIVEVGDQGPTDHGDSASANAKDSNEAKKALDELQRLADMREQNIITEKEFKAMKKRIIEGA